MNESFHKFIDLYKMLFELDILSVLLPFKINSWNRNILDSKFIVYMNVKGVEKT